MSRNDWNQVNGAGLILQWLVQCRGRMNSGGEWFTKGRLTVINERTLLRPLVLGFLDPGSLPVDPLSDVNGVKIAKSWNPFQSPAKWHTLRRVSEHCLHR